MCGLSIGKVEDLRKYCIEKYEELSRAPQQPSKNMEMPLAQSSVAEEQLPSRLVDCYQYCVKYHSDNPTALQGCRSMCDAMWKPSIQRVGIEQFRNCFPSGLLELGEFEARYRRVGLDDWQIVAHISGVISKIIEEGRRNKCPDLDETIIRVVTSKLDKMGIDRYSIRRAYLHGMSDEVKQLIMKVFPNVTDMAPPKQIPRISERPRSFVSQVSVTPSISIKQRRPPIKNYVAVAFSVILVILGSSMWVYGFIEQIMLPMIISFFSSIIALILGGKLILNKEEGEAYITYIVIASAIIFIISLISLLFMLGARTPLMAITPPTNFTNNVIL
ncbi:hypothetical protein [Vulcanisaeta sp. JCM 16161]|uniref:hypothetical protein n=1 Tax=Vulcanisaeta sp. JCM 16161 TaxID=1295372 RepID=UPI0006D08672|nr:hypothetical protein [Vulcanisaeta sp. JCM 16161]